MNRVPDTVRGYPLAFFLHFNNWIFVDIYSCTRVATTVNKKYDESDFLIYAIFKKSSDIVVPYNMFEIEIIRIS